MEPPGSELAFKTLRGKQCGRYSGRGNKNEKKKKTKEEKMTD